MQISFLSPHKSITSFPAIELPDFVVLTGVNGAGKSHLLQALELGNVAIEGIPVNQQIRTIRRYETNTLIPNETGGFQASQARQEAAQIWMQLSSIIDQFAPQLQRIAIDHSLLLNGLSAKKLIEIRPEDLYLLGLPKELVVSVFEAIQTAVNSLNEIVTQQFVQQDYVNRTKLLRGLLSKTKLKLLAFQEDDFFENYPIAWQSVDIFQQSFARLFSEYQDQKNQNEIKTWQNSKGSKHKVLTDVEFVQKFGEAPWDFVNSILESAQLQFRINEPSYELDRRPYEAVLTDKVTGAQVKFNDLSSGERVLMSFALCLYYAKDPQQIAEYPKVLLFDEIDAPLHPSMTQSLLRTIQEVLIGRHQIKVIMTTHSPSTVALAPEDSLYAMQKGDNDRFVKISKDRAISILLSGLPALSMSYENRRQIFVESPLDVDCYERLHGKLKQWLEPEISLSFISSGGSHEGGCDRVKKVVSTLVDAGNRSVFGLIDWDANNKSNGHVFVQGEGERYTIENFIFDPLLIAILLRLEKVAERADVGLCEAETHADFRSIENERLQIAADYVINKLAQTAIEYVRVQHEDAKSSGVSKVDSGQEISDLHKSATYVEKEVSGTSGNKSQVECELCKYVGGQSIQIPKWYLQMKGHLIKPLLDQAFPQLKKFATEQKLKVAILDRVIDDLPTLIPSSILDVFQRIQRTP